MMFVVAMNNAIDLQDQEPTDPTGQDAAPSAFETIGSAAVKLGLDPARLRRKCQRRGERVGDCIVALLPDGVVAFKFGGRWRVRFPKKAAAIAEARAS